MSLCFNSRPLKYLNAHYGPMDRKSVLNDALRTHPCYNEEAHKTYARMHLPVAPKCNIQCNYCNRKYDCSNESRPGVTSEILSPREAADKVRIVKEKIPNLKVIGIAGPGDPLANEETFETLSLISSEFPDLTLCVSTNGLALAENAQKLFDLGVRFLTVTMNASDSDIGGMIYDTVLWKGKKYMGAEGANILMERQLDGIKECVNLGMMIKINIVMIPGINDEHIPNLVKKVKKLGVYIVNILPLIPVDGTKFSDRRAPTSEERKNLMDMCSLDAKMMRHCRQCRADAIGLLGEDRSSEFVRLGSCNAGCGPAVNDPVPISITETRDDPVKMAIASSDKKNIDRGFGNAERFQIYSVTDNGTTFLQTIEIDTNYPVSGSHHKEHIAEIIDALDDCKIIIVKEIGPLPSKMLAAKNKTVCIASGKINSRIISSCLNKS
jgi:nitrogenase cofactor biosynthesis protein NifB